MLKRRLWVVVLCVLLTTGAAVAYSLLAEKQYTAQASLLFQNPQLGEKVFGSEFQQETADEARAAATNLKLISLNVVSQRTAERLGDGLTADDVSRQVSTSSEGQSDVVTIEAVSEDPRFASTLANTFGREFIQIRRDADRQKITEAIRLVERQLGQLQASEANGENARSLRRRLQDLQILASLQTGNAELVEVASTPGSPSAPRPLRNVALALVVGLLLGVALALLSEYLDRRVRDPEDLRDIFDRPLLTVIPKTVELADVTASHTSAVVEPFRMLRANLRYFGVDRDIRSILVTSAQPGDGKTTVAWNVGVASAAAGASTLVIEADLRRPGLSDYIVRPTAGLSGLLSHQAEFDEVVEPVAANLDVMLAGPLPPNPDELIDSARMRDVLRTAEQRYDFVVIDTPPTSVVSDAIPLIGEVSGVVVVGRLGQTTRDAAVHLAHQLENLRARLLGVVVNAAAQAPAGYGYYGYDSNGLVEAPTPRPGAAARS